MPRYAELIYNGFWFAPSGKCCRPDRQEPGAFDGIVRLKLYKGTSSSSAAMPKTLYSLAHVTFEEDQVYDQRTPKASSSSTRCACGC